MAALDDLINKIDNPELKLQMQHVVRKLLKQKKFGLVFEDHLPESTILQEREVRVGLTVTYKSEPLKERFFVRAINNDIAECISLNDTTLTRAIPIGDLVPFATFGEPIYPYLQVQDTISTAPDSPLWHSLIQADNYHALQLLAYLYPGKVDCIYIDPPYNTGAHDWKYNNDYVDSNDSYRHSKWLSMMKKRLLLAKKLLNPADSVLIVTIDEKESNHLGCLLEELFPNASTQMISTVTNPKGVNRNGFRRCDEYVYFVLFGSAVPQRLELSAEWSPSTKKDSNKSKKNLTPGWTSMMRRGSHSSRWEREGLYYAIYANPDTKTIEHIGQPIPSDHTKDDEIAGLVQIRPIRTNGDLGRWQVGPDELRRRIKQGRVRLGSKTDYGYVVNYLPDGEYSKILNGQFSIIGYADDGSIMATQSIEIDDESLAPSLWKVASHDASANGSTLIRKFLSDKRFEYPKSLYAVHDTLRFFVANKPNALIVDFFAGSGTTLHAVNLLNAEDGGSRRCIMVTNNEVGETSEKDLTAKGFKPGDEVWENLGIARYVNWPRTVASITGLDVKGQLIKGEYLTYLTTEKESNRRFQQISFVNDFSSLSLSEKKDLVTVLSKGSIAKSSVEDDASYIIDNDSAIAILLDEASASDWLEELEGQNGIRDFIICTADKKLFNSLKKRITELLGTFKEQVPLTLPMSDGFKANAIFFKLGFLDKQAVQMGRQFTELLPLLWMKSGAYGACPQISSDSIPAILILPQNKFAVLTNENEFGAFYDALVTANDIETVYIVTDSERGYREMAAQLRVRNSYQLYRDYLDNFTINTKGSI